MSTKKTEDWKTRLVEEREELLKKTIALNNTLNNPEVKMNNQEWEMLRRQFCSMQDYLQVLTDRCVYYKLIESANLNLRYY